MWMKNSVNSADQLHSEPADLSKGGVDILK